MPLGHSPEPWRFIPERACIVDAQGTVIATLAVEPTPNFTLFDSGNGRVIENAPAMLAACELALHKIEQTLAGEYPDGAALRAALGPLQSVLRSARGDDMVDRMKQHIEQKRRSRH